MKSGKASIISPDLTQGISGNPYGAGPPVLRIPMKSNSFPVDLFLLRFFSMAVGSNLLEWQIQNNLFPPASTAPGVH